jgi:hypothetical protein
MFVITHVNNLRIVFCSMIVISHSTHTLYYYNELNRYEIDNRSFVKKVRWIMTNMTIMTIKIGPLICVKIGV